MSTAEGSGKNLRNVYEEQGGICATFVLPAFIILGYLTSFLLQ